MERLLNILNDYKTLKEQGVVAAYDHVRQKYGDVPAKDRLDAVLVLAPLCDEYDPNGDNDFITIHDLLEVI